MQISPQVAVRICEGDEEAYAEFVRLQWPQSVRTAWLILRNVHDAEEAAQDAFLKLYHARTGIRDPAKFRTWFYRILVNAAMDKARRRKSTADISDMEIAESVDRMEQAELRIAIAEAMQSLSEEERIAIVLTHFNGLTESEAAAAARWNLGKFKYRLLRARRKLAKLLNHVPGSSDPVWAVFGKEGVHHAR